MYKVGEGCHEQEAKRIDRTIQEKTHSGETFQLLTKILICEYNLFNQNDVKIQSFLKKIEIVWDSLHLYHKSQGICIMSMSAIVLSSDNLCYLVWDDQLEQHKCSQWFFLQFIQREIALPRRNIDADTPVLTHIFPRYTQPFMGDWI